MLITVVWLGGEVDAAIAVWTLAYFLTALFALAVARDLWLPLALPNVLDRRGRAIAGLALVMGAVQIVNLIGYRVELFVLDHYEGLAQVGIYSIAVQAAEAMWLVPAAVATAVTGPAVHERADRSARLIRDACGRGLLCAVGYAAGGLAAWVCFVRLARLSLLGRSRRRRAAS
jgi:hypothetical protein